MQVGPDPPRSCKTRKDTINGYLQGLRIPNTIVYLMKYDVVGPSAYAINSWRAIQIRRISPSNAMFLADEKIRYFTKLDALRDILPVKLRLSCGNSFFCLS